MLSNESSTAPDAAIYRQSGHLGYCLCSTDARLPLTSSVHPLEDWWKGRLKVWKVKNDIIKILEVNEEVKGFSSIPYSKNCHMLPKGQKHFPQIVTMWTQIVSKLIQRCPKVFPNFSPSCLKVAPNLSQSCKVVSKLFPMLSKSCLKIVLSGARWSPVDHIVPKWCDVFILVTILPRGELSEYRSSCCSGSGWNSLGFMLLFRTGAIWKVSGAGSLIGQ